METYTYVNQSLKSIAANAEDYLHVPFFSDESTVGYDVEVSFFSLPDFETSLAKYGLVLEKTESYEMEKLKIVFY